MYGNDPVAIPLVTPRLDSPAGDNRLSEIKKLREEALAAHELARQYMAGRIAGNAPKFVVGQKVWLEAKNLHINTTVPRKFW